MADKTLTEAVKAVKDGIKSAYDKVSGKGGTVPEQKTIDNLPGAIDSITGGGGESVAPGNFGVRGSISNFANDFNKGDIAIQYSESTPTYNDIEYTFQPTDSSFEFPNFIYTNPINWAYVDSFNTKIHYSYSNQDRTIENGEYIFTGGISSPYFFIYRTDGTNQYHAQCNNDSTASYDFPTGEWVDWQQDEYVMTHINPSSGLIPTHKLYKMNYNSSTKQFSPEVTTLDIESYKVLSFAVCDENLYILAKEGAVDQDLTLHVISGTGHKKGIIKGTDMDYVVNTCLTVIPWESNLYAVILNPADRKLYMYTVTPKYFKDGQTLSKFLSPINLNIGTGGSETSGIIRKLAYSHQKKLYYYYVIGYTNGDNESYLFEFNPYDEQKRITVQPRRDYQVTMCENSMNPMNYCSTYRDKTNKKLGFTVINLQSTTLTWKSWYDYSGSVSGLAYVPQEIKKGSSESVYTNQVNTYDPDNPWMM